MPRVTEVIDYLMEPELFNWHIRMGKTACKKIGDEAKRIGTAVDELVQQDIREGGYLVPEGDSPIENCMLGWEKFKKDYPKFVPSIKFMQKEVREGELVGHPDFISDEIHRWGITDLKCSSGIRPRYLTQTSKYLDMERKMENRGEGFIAILRLEKAAPQGFYEYKEITDQEIIQYEIKVFEAYLTAFKHNENVREIMRAMLEKEILDVS